MFPNFKNSRLVAEVLCQLQLALLLRGAAVSGSDEYHRPDHVGGHIETGHPAAAVAIKVHQELAFAEVGCEAIGEGWLDFLIFSHPLPPHELAVLHDKCPGGAQFIIGVRARVIREVPVEQLLRTSTLPSSTGNTVDMQYTPRVTLCKFLALGGLRWTVREGALGEKAATLSCCESEACPMTHLARRCCLRASLNLRPKSLFSSNPQCTTSTRNSSV
jgi:hypothetical protein